MGRVFCKRLVVKLNNTEEQGGCKKSSMVETGRIHIAQWSSGLIAPLSLYGRLLCSWRKSPPNSDTFGYLLSSSTRS